MKRSILALMMALIMVVSMSGLVVGADALNMITDGDFENIDKVNMPSGWATNVTGGWASLFQEDVSTGNKYVAWTSSTPGVLQYVKSGFEAGYTYQLSFRYKTNGTGIYIDSHYLDDDGTGKLVEGSYFIGLTGLTVPSDTTQWAMYSTRVMYNGASGMLRFRFRNNVGTAADVAWDNLEVRKLSQDELANKISNGNMEINNGGMPLNFVKNEANDTVSITDEITAYSGEYCLKLPYATETNAVRTVVSGLSAGTVYRLSMKIKGNSFSLVTSGVTNPDGSALANWGNYPSNVAPIRNYMEGSNAPFTLTQLEASPWVDCEIFVKATSTSATFVFHTGTNCPSWTWTTTLDQYKLCYIDDMAFTPVSIPSMGLYNKYVTGTQTAENWMAYEEIPTLGDINNNEAHVVKATYFGSATGGDKVMLIAAQYSEDSTGTRKLLEAKAFTKEAGASAKTTFNEAITINQDADIIKLYMWETNSLKPYRETIDIR